MNLQLLHFFPFINPQNNFIKSEFFLEYENFQKCKFQIPSIDLFLMFWKIFDNINDEQKYNLLFTHLHVLCAE